MTQDDRGPESSSYIAWKGWVDETPFGQLEAGESSYFTSELRDVLPRGSESPDVLEVGFGNGAFLAYCRHQGWNVTGTELDPLLVQAAKDSGFAVYPADAVGDLPDRSFDLIAVFDVLEHIEQQQIVGFLSLLGAKLRPGGSMIFRFPNADSWLGNPLQNGDPTHVTQIGYLKMTYFALHANLEVVAFRGAKRHGFATSFANGIYSLVAGPIIGASAALKRMLYFPGLPVVLSTSNVVCVVRALPEQPYSSFAPTGRARQPNARQTGRPANCAWGRGRRQPRRRGRAPSSRGAGRAARTARSWSV
jgi:2-polyprenyl-3-methyl-5-hydroxy-6-metoxy-1,4-benzoquinol methylase